MAELSAQGPIIHSGATSVVDSVQQIKLGSRGFDQEGNEYVYVDFQEACIRGEWVVFTSAYLASQLTSTSRGFVGVVDGTVSASDRFGWVMVRGVHTAAWATSGSSSGFPVIAAATTDLGTVDTLGTSVDASVAISGVLVASAPDTCASTALSTSALAAPCTVILNYPFITGVVSVASS
jgi:hypothetical protein